MQKILFMQKYKQYKQYVQGLRCILYVMQLSWCRKLHMSSGMTWCRSEDAFKTYSLFGSGLFFLFSFVNNEGTWNNIVYMLLHVQVIVFCFCTVLTIQCPSPLRCLSSLPTFITLCDKNCGRLLEAIRCTKGPLQCTWNTQVSYVTHPN